MGSSVHGGRVDVVLIAIIVHRLRVIYLGTHQQPSATHTHTGAYTHNYCHGLGSYRSTQNTDNPTYHKTESSWRDMQYRPVVRLDSVVLC